jgi:hypothetical protein
MPGMLIPVFELASTHPEIALYLTQRTNEDEPTRLISATRDGGSLDDGYPLLALGPFEPAVSQNIGDLEFFRLSTADTRLLDYTFEPNETVIPGDEFTFMFEKIGLPEEADTVSFSFGVTLPTESSVETFEPWLADGPLRTLVTEP